MNKLSFTYICCAVLLFICLIALIGWRFDIIFLRTVVTGTAAVKPLSVFIILLLSLALFFTANYMVKDRPLHLGLSWFFAGLAILIISTAMVKYVLNLNVGVGLTRPSAQKLLNLEIPSLYTLINSLFIGLCILVAPLEFSFKNRLIVILMLLSWAIPYIILFDYAILLNPLEAVHEGPNTDTPLINVVCLLLLSSGVMGLWPKEGVVGLITAPSLGGVFVRFLLPAAVIIPLVLSWIFIYSKDHGLLGVNFEISLNWGITSLFMAGMIIVGGFLVHYRSEEKDKVLQYSRKGEEKFRALLESAPDAMVIVNQNGEIVLVNAQTERLFGYSRHELIGNKVEMLMPGRFVDVHKHHRKNYAEAPKVRMMGEGLELKGKRKDGEEFSVEISLSPIHTAEEVLVSAAIRDITETIKAKERIEELNRSLEQKVAERTAELIRARDNLEHEVQKRTHQLQLSNKELEAFSYSISHDLRAPLRSISGYSNVLMEDYGDKLDDEGERVISVVVKNAEKMGRLIDDILEFSRLSRVEIHKYRLDIGKMFRESFDALMAYENGERNIELKVDDLPEASGDPVLISQAINNFISNAIKYTRPREVAKIHIGSIQEEGENVFFVGDNGVGFDENYKDKLFGVFQRLHKDNEFEGTGVGLAIVNRVISRHGGRVWVKSKINEGTTFFFTLPE